MKQIFTLIAILIIAFPSQGQAADLESLLEMDIEDLVQISVASKVDEPVHMAPSVVTLVTQDDIRRYGAKNLRDILVRLPSFQTYGSHFLTGNALSVRGTSDQHYFSRGLFLINGRPVRGSIGGGSSLSLQNMFPVESIKKIEVIRGPASTLYGTGALSSVINIVTESNAPIEEEAALSVAYGSNDYKDIRGSYQNTFSDVEFVSYFHAKKQNGWDTTYVAENGVGEFNDQNDGYAAFIQTKYKNLSLDAFYSGYEFENMSISNRYPSLYEQFRRLFTNIGYEHQLSDKWQADLNATYNLYLPEADEQAHSNDLFLEASFKGQLTDRLSLLTGVGFDHQNGRYLGSVSYNKNIMTWYAQSDYRATDWLKLVAGLQYNKTNQDKGDYSPRLAAVVNLDEHWTLKTLYSEAYRDPASLERDVNVTGVLVSDPTISAERIETKELQLLYRKPRYSASITYYNSLLSDQISRQQNPSDTGLIITNSGAVRFEGIELETELELDEHWHLDGSLTWQRNEDSLDIEEGTFTPSFMAKLGVSYDSLNGWDIGIFDSYFGEPTKVSELNPSVQNVNPEAEAYHWVTANLNVDVKKFLSSPSLPNTTLSLYAENLAGEDIFYPEFNRNVVNTFPSYAGRSIFARLKVEF